MCNILGGCTLKHTIINELMDFPCHMFLYHCFSKFGFHLSSVIKKIVRTVHSTFDRCNI